MFKQKKSQVLLFLGSVGHFFVFFFFWFKKKNVGSGLILGSVGLRQYNNFFFWPYCLQKDDPRRHAIHLALLAVRCNYSDMLPETKVKMTPLGIT